MEAKPYPITLIQTFFTRTIVIALAEHDGFENKATVLPSPDNNINLIEIEGDQGAYHVIMRTRINIDENPAYPYVIDMECVALLRADESLSGDEAKRGVITVGHSVVYGAIREAISWITGRHPYGPIIIGLSILQPKPADD